MILMFVIFQSMADILNKQSKNSFVSSTSSWLLLFLISIILKMQAQVKSEVNWIKEIISKINEIESKSSIEKLNKTKSWFFEKNSVR